MTGLVSIDSYKPPVPYDLCAGIPISCLLIMFRRLFIIVSKMLLIKGLHRDFEIFASAFEALLLTSTSAGLLRLVLTICRWHATGLLRSAAWPGPGEPRSYGGTCSQMPPGHGRE